MIQIFRCKQIVGRSTYWCWDTECRQAWYADVAGVVVKSSIYKYPCIPYSYQQEECQPEWVLLRVGAGL